MKEKRRFLRNPDVPFHTVLVLLGVLCLIPFLVTLLLSFKDLQQFNAVRWRLTLPLHHENYTEAWRSVRVYLFNSLLVSGGGVAGIAVLSVLGGYAFARGRFPLKEPIFVGIIAGMLIPGILLLIPKFILYRDLHLLNSYWAYWVSYWAEGQILGIFLVRNSMEGIPQELFEAAETDGANSFQQLLHIALPLSKPILGALVVLNLLFTWNDIIWPWIAITDNSLRTISIGLSIFSQNYLEPCGPMFAGYVIASLPLIVVFCFSSRLFISGLTSGAFKA